MQKYKNDIDSVTGSINNTNITVVTDNLGLAIRLTNSLIKLFETIGSVFSSIADKISEFSTSKALVISSEIESVLIHRELMNLILESGIDIDLYDAMSGKDSLCWFKNGHGKYVVVNKAFMDETQMNPKDVLGKTNKMIIANNSEVAKLFYRLEDGSKLKIVESQNKKIFFPEIGNESLVRYKIINGGETLGYLGIYVKK